MLAIDVGNTNVTLGLFERGKGQGQGKAGGWTLRADWRLETRSGRTADEYAALLGELYRRAGLDLDAVTAVAISSVVPPALAPLEQLCRRHLEIEPLIVGPGIKTGVPILYENPREVGADRIVNAVAAYERWPEGAIVVDFGTATTFDVVTARGEYAGGVIAPGLTRLGRRALPGDGQAAARGDRPPRHGDRPQHRRQHAVGPGVRLRRAWSTPSSSASAARSTSRRAWSAPAGWRRSSRARRAASTSATTC